MTSRTRFTLIALRALIRVETIVCPAGQYEQVLTFILDELDTRTSPDPVRKYMADTGRHLRRHGLFPLLGAVLVGVGTTAYSFVNASLLQDIGWPVAGIGLILGLPVIVPSVDLLRGGCPYLVEANPPPAEPLLRRPRFTAIVGLLITLVALAMPVHQAVFDIPALVGVLISGIGIFLLAAAVGRKNRRMLVTALRTTGIGAILVAIGDGGHGVTYPTCTADVVASLITAVGASIYAGTVTELIGCFDPFDANPESCSKSKKPDTRSEGRAA